MTNRERDSMAKLLLDVIAELADAPKRAGEHAKSLAALNPAHAEAIYSVSVQAYLTLECQEKATRLRHLIAEFVKPRPKAPSRRARYGGT